MASCPMESCVGDWAHWVVRVMTNAPSNSPTVKVRRQPRSVAKLLKDYR